LVQILAIFSLDSLGTLREGLLHPSTYKDMALDHPVPDGHLLIQISQSKSHDPDLDPFSPVLDFSTFTFVAILAYILGR
jgi:hypothetical protein